LVGRPEQGGHLEDRMILKCTFKKSDRETWTGLMWSSLGTGGGLLLMR
jgi:hypothetical protein